MNALEAVLFDLDGSLVDTAPDFYRICNEMLIEEGYPSVRPEKLRLSVSNGGRAVIRASFAIEDDHPDFERLLTTMLSRYEANPAQNSHLFATFDHLLAWLESQSIPWGVVTNKPARFTYPLMQQLSLTERCAVIICPDDVKHSKPDPEGLILACQRIGCNPKHALYVGDHRRDIDAGKAAGMTTIAVTFGYLQPDDYPENWESDYIIEQPADLIHLLKSFIDPNAYVQQG